MEWFGSDVRLESFSTDCVTCGKWEKACGATIFISDGCAVTECRQLSSMRCSHSIFIAFYVRSLSLSLSPFALRQTACNVVVAACVFAQCSLSSPSPSADRQARNVFSTGELRAPRLIGSSQMGHEQINYENAPINKKNVRKSSSLSFHFAWFRFCSDSKWID